MCKTILAAEDSPCINPLAYEYKTISHDRDPIYNQLTHNSWFLPQRNHDSTKKEYHLKCNGRPWEIWRWCLREQLQRDGPHSPLSLQISNMLCEVLQQSLPVSWRQRLPLAHSVTQHNRKLQLQNVTEQFWSMASSLSSLQISTERRSVQAVCILICTLNASDQTWIMWHWIVWVAHKIVCQL